MATIEGQVRAASDAIEKNIDPAALPRNLDAVQWAALWRELGGRR